MATWNQHISAFFDPTIAVNENGDLVHADGFFDSGRGSTDYVSYNEIMDSPTRRGFYGDQGDTSIISDGIHPSVMSDVSSSDVVGDYDEADLNQLYDDVIAAVESQNTSAQASADAAMEFSRDEAEKARTFNADQAQLMRDYNAEQALLARQFNADQAQINRDWQEVQNQKAMDYQTQMSNTAYQRAMADLKAAGLNPKLVAKIGGASTMSGITSSGSAASGMAASGSAASSSAPSGVAANMQMANVAAVAQVLSTYITGADALDRNQNDFVQGILTTLLPLLLGTKTTVKRV